jgi:uncharacterized protein YbjT (DUF2867 family)
MEKAFVTGGSGFVGRELIAALRAKGVAVRALARSDDAAATVEKLGAEPLRGDLVDHRALVRGVAGCDTVFHAAAYVEDWGPREDFFRTNVEAPSTPPASIRSPKRSPKPWSSSPRAMDFAR